VSGICGDADVGHEGHAHDPLGEVSCRHLYPVQVDTK
jgi:hypothetical protein